MKKLAIVLAAILVINKKTSANTDQSNTDVQTK